ncbi:hypothetical protein [Acutalibacter intestini]|nr:hypothetical protein [Acutalibacter sp. M00204]
MKNIKITVNDEELMRIACELAEEMGIPLSDEPDSFCGKPVFPELKEEA